jgi:hypothetical protein
VTATANTPNPRTAEPEDPVDQNAVSPTVQSDSKIRRPTGVVALPSPLSQTGDVPTEVDIPAESGADSHEEISRALDRASEAMDMLKTWKRAVDVTKQLMDVIGPVAEVRGTSFLPIFH